MKKWIKFIIPLAVVLLVSTYGFKAPSVVKVPESLIVKTPVAVLFPKQEIPVIGLSIAPPFLGTSFVAFKEALAFKESRGNYFSTNTLGYLGKYQFGIGTLEMFGIYNATKFLNDPVLQEKAFHTNVSRNKWILRKDIERHVGKMMGGIVITESGILAAAHLAGPGNVKKYLRSYGSDDLEDVYGASIGSYMRKFSGYDVSHVSPVKNPKVNRG